MERAGTQLASADGSGGDARRVCARGGRAGREFDLHIETLDNTITIRGKREYKRNETDRNVHRMENRYGEFQRTFEVPGGFDNDNVKAELRDGVLRVTLPKRESAKPQRIELSVK